MLKQLTSPQLAELEQFWALEGGWGDYKQDYRMGQLCSIQAEVNRNKKKKSQPYRPDDFAMRPKMQKPTPSDNAEKIRSTFDMLAGANPEKKRK